MKICFALPCTGRRPLGGLRIVYEHANRLAARGHEITILHVISATPGDLSAKLRLKGYLRYWRERLTSGYRPTSWFALDARVKTTWSFSLRPEIFPVGDAVIATGWQTADVVAALPPEHGRKFYFIQHYESWDCPESRLRATWRLPLRKIVIAHWLADIAAEMGEPSDYVPNAIDLAFFRMTRDPSQRKPRSILLQSHEKNWKGTSDALQALTLLRQRGVAFELNMFGLKVPEKNAASIPHRYIYNPAQSVLKDLYNETAIFVAASWAEGWGLTAHEAAACGAALAVTDVGGHNEFLRSGESALMSPPKNPAALADNLGRLLADSEFRIALAQRGRDAVQGFTWERSSAAFEQALQGQADRDA